jgi:copper chaperone CopZ
MKKVILSIAMGVVIALASCKNESKKENETKAPTEEVKSIAENEATFGVRGNCGMCKKTIEKAANAVSGVSKAVWDVDKKKIEVSFDASKTNLLAIHKAIAASGYDTEKATGSESAYGNLPGCCQYDHEMKMNQ